MTDAKPSPRMPGRVAYASGHPGPRGTRGSWVILFVCFAATFFASTVVGSERSAGTNGGSTLSRSSGSHLGGPETGSGTDSMAHSNPPLPG